jgi:hypothetical protein
MVCAKRRYHFGAADGFQGDETLVEARFDPFVDSANLDAK